MRLDGVQGARGAVDLLKVYSLDSGIGKSGSSGEASRLSLADQLDSSSLSVKERPSLEERFVGVCWIMCAGGTANLELENVDPP